MAKLGNNRIHLRIPPIERLSKKYVVNPENGCWEWTANTLNSGYGQFKMAYKKPELAHRASYMIYVGEIPEDMVICHKCDNKKCVNPEHLFVGTHKDNDEDARNKGIKPPLTHPSVAAYMNGCRCEGCIDANRQRYIDYKVRKAKGELRKKPNGFKQPIVVEVVEVVAEFAIG